ncbi:hypothetical protein [Streptodolium elevatio]
MFERITYAMTTVVSPRPVRGADDVEGRCSACGARFVYRVWSRSALRRRRVAWTAVLHTGIAVLVVWVLLMNRYPEASAGGHTVVSGSVWAVGVIGLAGVLQGVSRLCKEDGTRLVDAPSRHRGFRSVRSDGPTP